MTVVHASCVELLGIAVLLRGPSGSGKSDLALRLIDGGAQLVADDRVVLAAADGVLRAVPVADLRGVIEARGLGLLDIGASDGAVVGLVVDLTPGAVPVRLPQPDHCELCGVKLPVVSLDPFQPSAAAKLRLAVRALVEGRSLRGALGDGGR